MTFSPADHKFMRRALTLAPKGQGRVEPNPMVGAVLVKNHRIIAQGYTQPFGGPHAEVDALRRATESPRNATLYVTLEPCCHHGKTPPCTDAILAAGISRVVAAMVDPFPLVSGQGIQRLRDAGLQVDVGLLQPEAEALNRPFLTRIQKHRPFFLAKWAQSLDGAIATAAGQSQWISSEPSRALVHQLRGRMDAILTGIGTALSDNPRLTARLAHPSDLRRTATRILLDSACRLPLTSHLATTAQEIPTLLFHQTTLTPAAKKRRSALLGRGVQCLPLPQQKNGLSLPALAQHLHTLNFTNILLECGPTLMASFLHAQLIDEFHLFLAPILIPGPSARRPLLGPNLASLPLAPRLTISTQKPIGPDLYLIAHPCTPPAASPTIRDRSQKSKGKNHVR